VAQNLTYDASSRSGIASRGNASAMPEVLANPLIQSLKAEVMRAEAKLQELSTRLGPNHPQYRQQASEIAALRSRLNGETSRIVAGSQNATAQSRAREQQLQAALAEQRKKVVEMRDARNHSYVMQRDVETAQKAYEAALARYLVNKVESGARSANVTVFSSSTKMPPSSSVSCVVKTSRSGALTSRTAPVTAWMEPSGPRMSMCRVPPGRRFISARGAVYSCGPHHCARCRGSVHASHTSARGASNTRVSTSVRWEGRVSAR